MELTPGAEDYLKAIYEIANEKPVVRMKDISNLLNVKSSSVASMMKYLTERNLIIHEKYGYIQLTKDGEQIGKYITNRNNIITEFLQKILKLDDTTANEDACNIEHYLNKKTVNRVVKFLEFINLSSEDEPQWMTKFGDFLQTGEFECEKKISINEDKNEDN